MPNVMADAIIPCRNLPKIYGFKLSPASAITDITCKCTLSPENPTTNEVITSFDIISVSRAEMRSTPVENSQAPDTIARTTGDRGSKSSNACAIDEKNIIEKQTVSIFLAALSIDIDIALEIDISFVFTCVNGEL